MQSLKDLTDQAPLGDIDAFIQCLDVESDRSAAIMVTALMEVALYVLLNCCLADWGETRRNEWFEGPTAPFRSLSAKIMLGQAIFLFGEETTERLNRIRNIRNTFAHAAAQIDFKTPAIAKEVRALQPRPLKSRENAERLRFCSTCLWLAKEFVRLAEEESGKERETKLP